MTPLERAESFASYHGWRLQALHAYEGPRFWVLRMRDRDGKKQIRPMRETEEGRYELGLPEFPGGRRPLYRPDVVRACPGRPVFLVEGENCADVLNALGSPDIAATTWHGGTGSVARVDFSPLVRRNVLLWPDNDAAGMEAMRGVKGTLKGLGCWTYMVSPDTLELPDKGDAADFMAAQLGTDKRNVTGRLIEGLSGEKKGELIRLVEEI
ncbi:MAG: hypothetical protein WCS71_06855 [Sphaerochaetaceae bacterium]